ncbi:MAG: hypothetical protein EBE86_034030 [Hormoscilla sp. GUM202]|nr:hypothetical protein [Hormoscilla sp. GUM202]
MFCPPYTGARGRSPIKFRGTASADFRLRRACFVRRTPAPEGDRQLNVGARHQLISVKTIVFCPPCPGARGRSPIKCRGTASADFRLRRACLALRCVC